LTGKHNFLAGNVLRRLSKRAWAWGARHRQLFIHKESRT
jgi:hypothetical protein